jgi:hypothetical protein
MLVPLGYMVPYTLEYCPAMLIFTGLEDVIPFKLQMPGWMALCMQEVHYFEYYSILTGGWV